jgi:hypothetical protein
VAVTAACAKYAPPAPPPPPGFAEEDEDPPPAPPPPHIRIQIGDVTSDGSVKL